jgi:nucleotide-binding universal stress UspA family protein
MIYFAYDGSINSDWVARYAMRLAARSAEKKLVLLHIQDGEMPPARIKVGMEAISQECRDRQVDFFAETRPLHRDVFHSLSEILPSGEDDICVCGTRIRSKRKGFLSGTIAAKLLQAHKLPVIAIRVVQPGILGNARQLLMPLSGHPRRFRSVRPFFRLFAPDLQDIFLLRVMDVGSYSYRRLSVEQARALRAEGRSYLQQVAEDIKQEYSSPSFSLDMRVVVSDDWAKEILIHASKLKTRLMIVGASEKTLPARFIYGNPLEVILRQTPCDVGIYRGL